MQSFANSLTRASPAANNRWETTNSKPHGPIIMLDQSENSGSCFSPIIEGGLFFFFFQFCDVATAALCHHHPQEELAKFGYRSAREESRTFLRIPP